jgi:16S rRNA (cytidine1402-2'-O)-methyltransferase
VNEESPPEETPEQDAPSRDPSAGALLVVATPIGNLDDLSKRAEMALREADRVLAEDTRRTRGLLSHLAITGKPLDRLDAHAPAGAIRAAVERIARGERLALVTDAGTPLVSDPGSALVKATVAAGLRVIPIPGASAVLAALAGSGLVEGAFRFLGFLPRAGEERADALDQVVGTPEAVVLFEAANRLAATLADLARRTPDRRATVARELTKLHEEFTHGTLADLAALDREWLGEIALVLGPHAPPGEAATSEEQLDQWVDAEIARGASAKEAARVVAARAGLPRREVYARVLSRKQHD